MNQQLNNLRDLAGIAIVESSDAGTGVVDVTPTVQAIESPQKEVPVDVRKALEHVAQTNNKDAEDQLAKGDQQTHTYKNTVSSFATELCHMLDGSEDGFKRAGQHLHSALNSIVNEIPDVVIKYLSGNSLSTLNTDELNKEGIRKHLRSYVEDRRA